MRSLVHVCSLKRDLDTEGLIAAASTRLQHVETAEKDSRVLEAFAVGQVCWWACEGLLGGCYGLGYRVQVSGS